MAEKFISEPINPVAGSFDTARMSAGEPGVPGEFIWRRRKYIVKATERSWRKTRPCTHGSGERYVKRHYYLIVVSTGERMTVYFERKPYRGRSRVRRWWLLSIVA